MNSTADDNDVHKGDGICATATGECTLRAAITEANAQGSGPHTIYIPSGTYILTGASGEQGNVSGDLDVAQSMTISGAGVDATIIDGGGKDRVWNILTSGVTISGMTIRNGYLPGADGGCISVAGDSFALTDAKVTGCTGKNGAGIVTSGNPLFFNNVTISGCTTTTGKGGAIYSSSGTITMANSLVEGNKSPSGGGIYTMTAASSITNVTFSGNMATGGSGGAYYSQSGSGNTLTNVTITGNSATSNGGGLYSGTGRFTLKNVILANNTPSNCSGGIISAGYNLDSANSCGLKQIGDKTNADANLGILQDNGGPTRTHALIIGSAAIDAGTTVAGFNTDQRGVGRPIGAAWDMGAFEGTYIPVYKPDAMIKLFGEGDASFLKDSVYESVASQQSKNGRVISGAMATYILRFQNHGNMPDSFKITGTLGSGTSPGFTVQYLDESSADRTLEIKNGTCSISNLGLGQSKEWTLRVTPSGTPTPVAGGTSYNVFVTATSTHDTGKSDQVVAVTTSTSPNLTLLKSADKATAKPGDEISYTTSATNGTDLTDARNVILYESIPANTRLKVGAASFTPNNSNLTCTISYSSNNRSTWDYTPPAENCSAPPYDTCVTDIRYQMQGNMPPGSSFSVGFVVGIK